jgi:hypothetical protein
LQYYDLLKGRLAAINAEYKSLLSTDVAEFDRAVTQAGLPRIAPAPDIEKTD